MVTAKGNGYLLDDDGAYHVITTAADDATTALSEERPRVVVKGTGINHIFTTPSAAALTRAHFVISNWSSEFVGVMNSDSTLWLRVAPSQTATVWLVTGGTAAGVWGADLSPIHPDYGFENVEDFIYGAVSTGINVSGIYSSTSGTGATAGPLALISGLGTTTGIQGLGRIYTGTDTTGGGYHCFHVSSLVAGQGVPLRCFADQNFITLAADATDDYVIDIGFGDVATAGDHTDGAWLRYDRAKHATNWQSGVAGGGSATVADTATAVPIATLFDLNMEIASDSSRFDVWMNRILIATVTGANIPTTGEFFGFVMKMYNTAGTANDRTFYHDRLGIMGAKNKRRGLA